MIAPLTLGHVSHTVREGGSEKQTLAPLSCSFDPGKFHVVSGPSGAGKTTLLSILSLAVKATHGLIYWGDINLSALSPSAAADWRKRNLGMVFQTSRLVSVMTTAEHIQMAASIRAKPQAREHGLTILDALGMGDKLSKRPDQLSGGEKQRVALAQALCARPAILLADEPTAALDKQNAGFVAQTLRSYARERDAIVVCVSHDRAVIDVADELLILAKA
jgi:putative ABC transport system ATP-binding protein